MAPGDLVIEDVRFHAGDDSELVQKGVDLAGWTIHTVHGAPAVVLVHGFKTSREEMLPWARFLHDAGFNVLLFDTRGCGKSGGSTVGLGATEPRDISLAVELARDQFGTTKVAVLGISLGAGSAILAGAKDPSISAVVADSAWTDQDFQLSRLSFLPLGPLRVPLLPYGVGAVNLFVGADVSQARPLDAIARIAPRPILLIHSADDDNATTPLEGARKLFAAAGEPKELWVAPRGGHVGAINAFPDEYRARVVAFLRAAFG
jgi:pimeloyl-ACP methyl ester carboxylesterase